MCPHGTDHGAPRGHELVDACVGAFRRWVERRFAGAVSAHDDPCFARFFRVYAAGYLNAREAVEYAHASWRHIDTEGSVLFPESEPRLRREGVAELASRDLTGRGSRGA